MWVFAQKTGAFYRVTDDGKVTHEGDGYAGRGTGKNNPLMQTVHNVGPLPCGFYIMGEPIDHPHVGKWAIPLIPDPNNQMWGRSEFFWHGDNPAHPGESSDGCPISNYLLRKAASQSGDSLFRVVQEFI